MFGLLDLTKDLSITKSSSEIDSKSYENMSECLQENLSCKDELNEVKVTTTCAYINNSEGIPGSESEAVRNWEEKRRLSLEEKDRKEKKAIEDLQSKALKDIEEWYLNYNAIIRDNKDPFPNSELHEENSKITEDNEWDRVVKMCSLETTKTRRLKDVSRMESVLLKLVSDGKHLSS